MPSTHKVYANGMREAVVELVATKVASDDVIRRGAARIGHLANFLGISKLGLLVACPSIRDSTSSTFTSFSQRSAVPLAKPMQMAKVSCAGAVRDRQPDLHQPRRQSALQLLAPYSRVAAQHSAHVQEMPLEEEKQSLNSS